MPSNWWTITTSPDRSPRHGGDTLPPLLRLAPSPGLKPLDVAPHRLGMGVVGQLVAGRPPRRVQLRALTAHPFLELVQLPQGLPEPGTERRPRQRRRDLAPRGA